MEFPVPESHDINRRDWIGRVIQMAGAGLFVHTLSAQESETAWKPAFFNDAQNEDLVALGEAIIPGSKNALCNRVIDLVLSIDSEKNKSEFVSALSAFDAAAHRHYGKRLAGLQAGEFEALLTQASSPGNRLSPQFHLVKEWFADTYWSSKQGLRELGWTGRVAWRNFDGCPHAGSHA